MGTTSRRAALVLAFGCLSAICDPATVRAQSFVEAVEGVPTADGSYAILKDGTRLEGKVKGAMLMGDYIKSLSFVGESGEKRQLKADDIAQLGAKMGGLLKWMTAMNSIGELASTPWGRAAQLSDIDWGKFMNREYVLFDQAVLPNGKTRLLQKLNPGFDNRLGVYKHFKTVTVGGDDSVSSYLLVKDGRQAFVVKKKTYQEQFPGIYGDCPAFADAFEGAEPKFEDMAGHVAAYDRLCPNAD